MNQLSSGKKKHRYEQEQWFTCSRISLSWFCCYCANVCACLGELETGYLVLLDIEIDDAKKARSEAQSANYTRSLFESSGILVKPARIVDSGDGIASWPL